MILNSKKDQGQVSIRELLDKNSTLEAEVQDLKTRLEEAEELKRAISEGDLDALIIPGPGPQGKLIFTLDSADRVYRVLVETMNEGTVTFAGDGTILYCNRRFAELVKMRPQAIVSTSIYGFIESEDKHTFKALLNQRTSAGEIKLQAADGISVPVYLSISSLQSEESQNAWCLVATDLTEQKKNEETVSAGLLAQSIIEQAAEAIVVCDTKGKITHFSNAVPRICECDPAFQKFENIMDLRFSEGEDAGKSMFPVSSVLKGDTIIGMEAILEVKDCQGFHKKLNFLLNSGPLKNANGRIIGCVVTLTDITELKQLEEKTRRRAEEIETIMETAPVAIWMSHDPKCHNITGNRMANEFYDAEAGENVSANATFARRFFYKGRELTAEELPMQQASLKDIDVRNKEIDVLLPKGEWRTLLGSASPLHNAEGNVRGSIGTFIDITERKQAEKELLEREKRFKLLSEANSTLLLSKEPENTIEIIAGKVMHHLNCDVFLNYEFDEKLGRLHLNAYSGINKEVAREIEWLEKGSAICGCVAQYGYRIVSENIQYNKDNRVDLVRSMGIQAYACQPLQIGEKIIGTLSFGTRNRKNFTEDELALMSTVADQVSVAIERKRAENVIKTTAINLVRAERLASLGHWDWDLTTNKIKWSDSHFSIFGYTEAQGMETYEMWRARIHPEDLERVEKILREGMEKDMGYNWDYRLLMPDSSIRYIHAEADRPVKNASGKPVRWFGIVQDITEQKLAENALRKSRAQIETELMDTRLLQSISAELLHEDNVQALYEKIIDAAMQIMHSEYASIQMFYPERGKSGELKLIAFRGFSPQAAKFWEWVGTDSAGSTCGVALRIGQRVIVSDIEKCNYIQGTEDVVMFMQSGIHACQTTPLFSRTGKLVGMISTHWRNPHQPSERDLQLLDILARQAADLIDRKQAEAALRESEEKYRNIIETANEGIWIVDPEARIAYANQKIAEMLGYSHEEIIGRSAWDFTDGENKETARQNMERIKQGIDGDYELRLIRKNGSLLWTIVSAKALFDKDGNFTGSMKMLTDITERKEAEIKLKQTLDNLEKLVKERTAELEKAYNSLKESESSLAEAQKMAHLGSWYRNLITDKVYWSDEVYRIFGFKPQEFEVTIGAYFSHIHPEDRNCVKKSLKRALSGKPYSIDYRIISASGTEHIVHSQGEVVFNEKKIPVGIKGTIQDITEQKLAMEKIKKSEERVQLYLQNFRGIGTQLGKNFIPVFLHGAVEELTGYMKEDFLSGKVRWNEIVVPEDRPGLQEKAQKMKSTLGMTVRHEYRIMKKNGEIRWIHGIAQNISELGNEELYQGMMYDITDRKKAEEALEKTDKIRIKEIHHRIKNNLQVICSILSLEAERFSDEKMLEAFKESQNRVASMALIHEELYRGEKNDFLDFAAYLSKFTADLFKSYNLGNGNINLKTDLESVYLDMDAAVPLGIIINELISNSLKHAFPAGSEGEINISLHRTETLATGSDESNLNQDCREKENFQYILRVADNGRGIPEEMEIGDADSLGLQLVNILVDQIDGCIELKRDCGTDFTIWFGNKEP